MAGWVTLLTLGAAATRPAGWCELGDALDALEFPSGGTVIARQTFSPHPIPCVYLEPEAPTRARWAWADGHSTPLGPHEYLYEVASNGSLRAPPLGMRSAPPLGGLSTGTLELRADGSMRAWTVENASPAGSTKVAALDDATLGLWVGGAKARAPVAKLLRTHPPRGLPGVAALNFSGAVPFTKLTPDDADVPRGVHVYGWSRWRYGDIAGSAHPAVGFTLTARAPPDAPLDVALVLAVPLPFQPGVARAPPADGAGAGEAARGVDTATDCYDACDARADCAAWHFEPPVAAPASCVLYTNGSAVPPAANAADGVASGVRGAWTKGARANCLALRRDGAHAASGGAALCAGAGAAGGAPSRGVAGSLEALWADFAAGGGFGGAGAERHLLSRGAHGGVAIRLRVGAGRSASGTLSLGWRFPHRDFMGAEVGNKYAALVTTAEDASAALLDARAAAADVGAWGAFARSLVGAESSVPTWLGDALLNSLHHTRSAMWLADGRWRQWESFSCVNVDSVHNDGERHVPYAMIWPESIPSKLRAWAAGQGADGMIAEQLACGCMAAVPPALDSPCGRVMGDVSSMFIVYVYEAWVWHADADLVKQLWPAAAKAARWQMARAGEFGLPSRVVDTYDGLELSRYNVSAFSAFFHLLSMRAAAALARTPPVRALNGSSNLADECDRAFDVGVAAVDNLLWSDEKGYFRSYTGGDALMADALYAQVLADTLGLGPLGADAKTHDGRVLSHLHAVAAQNDSPYGLLAQTGRYGPKANSADNAVWMMGPPNWASLALRRGLEPPTALAVARKALDWWRVGLRDTWNIAALVGGVGYGADGLPHANSHYGYHLVAWHIVFALSGQSYDAPTRALAFAPVLPAPYALPVLVPNTAAQLRARADGVLELRVLAGAPLALDALSVRGSAPKPGELPRTLAPGQSVAWGGPAVVVE